MLRLNHRRRKWKREGREEESGRRRIGRSLGLTAAVVVVNHASI